MAIKFGYMLDFRMPPALAMAPAEFYAAMFRQAEFADQSGLDSIWVTEHHFTDDGYLAAVMPTLAALAARTQRVALGTYVLLAPFYHPLRLAEDAAAIDVISNGRLRLGIGSAYRAEEFDGFQVSRETRLSRTLETIEILRRAWTGERFSHSGRHFQFKDVRVLPRPVSLPHPEILWAGMTRRAIERGAEYGLSFACNLGLKEVTLYRERLAALGRDPAQFSIVNSRIVYVADTPEAAWREIEAAAMYQAELYGKWLGAAAGPDQNWIVPDADRIKRGAILGPPDLVASRLAELAGTNLMTEIILSMQLPGLAPDKAHRSLERFAAEVLPILRRA